MSLYGDRAELATYGDICCLSPYVDIIRGSPMSGLSHFGRRIPQQRCLLPSPIEDDRRSTASADSDGVVIRVDLMMVV